MAWKPAKPLTARDIQGLDAGTGKRLSNLTFKEISIMLKMLKGWFPGNSRTVECGERVFIGDHLGPGSTPRARGLTNLALGGRLSFLTVDMTARMV
jgi:hypothetical protein